MSGAGGKKVADVTFKASKNIDWDGMAKLLVSDEARRESVNVRRSFDEVNHTLRTKFSLEPEPIDAEEEKSLKGSERLEKEIADVQELKRKLSAVTADEYFAKQKYFANHYWGY